MRKLTFFAAAMVALLSFLCGCSKHNSGGNPYYVSFQSGTIFYSRPVEDTFFQCQDTVVGSGIGMITMESYRSTGQTDSAAAGLLTLATWDIILDNYSSPSTAFVGNYTTDTGAANHKIVRSDSRFRFYTSTDPHHGQYWVSPGLPFAVTVTRYTVAWFEGTFEGKLVGTNNMTQAIDTVSITNGKFKLPFNQW